VDIIKFNSITELAAHVERLQTGPDGRRYGKSSTNRSTEETGGWTMEDAIQCARNGGDWQEGANAIPVFNMQHSTLEGRKQNIMTLESAPCGFAPLVPALLACQPDSMLDAPELPSGDKLLRVAVHVGRSWTVTQNHALNRGAAIMAALNQLSHEGYSIELHAIWRNTAEKATASVETCIKHGHDYWSPASVAFALAHVAFQRRLCWRVAESMKNGGDTVTDDSYGSGHSATFPDYDVSFPYFMGTESELKKYETLQSAVKEIKTHLRNELSSLMAAA
jgi:hypothetical protein